MHLGQRGAAAAVPGPVHRFQAQHGHPCKGVLRHESVADAAMRMWHNVSSSKRSLWCGQHSHLQGTQQVRFHGHHGMNATCGIMAALIGMELCSDTEEVNVRSLGIC